MVVDTDWPCRRVARLSGLVHHVRFRARRLALNDPSEAEVMAHSAGYAKALDDCDRADVAALIKERDVLRVDLAFERARRSTAERQRDDAQAHAAMLSEQRKADDEAFGRYMNDIKALADDKARLREALRPFAQTLERYRFGPNELLDITRANGERLNVLLAENFAAARTVLAAERTATGGEERTYGGMTLDYLGGSNDTVTAELVAHIRELLTRGAV